jgi:uncharacterized repeat protein (TIGR01451 family)
MAVTKTVSPGGVPEGSNLTFTITVTNLGSKTATDVMVTDTLPAEVTYLSDSSSDCSLSGSNVVCNFGSMAAGTGLTFNIVVTADQLGSYTNAATVGASTVDTNSGNNSASAAFSVTNRPPEPVGDTIERLPTQTIKVRVTDLLSNDDDPDGDTVVFDGVISPTVNGATVTVSGAWVLYAPPPGFTNADSFVYNVSDGNSGVAAATVQVNIKGQGTNPSQNVTGVAPEPGGGIRVTFAGIPGRTYSVEFTDDLVMPNWQLLGTATANAQGVYEIVDPAGTAMRAYRSVFP